VSSAKNNPIASFHANALIVLAKPFEMLPRPQEFSKITHAAVRPVPTKVALSSPPRYLGGYGLITVCGPGFSRPNRTTFDNATLRFYV